MATRRAAVIVIVSSVGLSALPACSEATRHRVLSFLFDGVPGPGATRAGVRATRAAAGPAQKPSEPAEPARPLRTVSTHAPYRENRCRDCHDPGDRLLHRTPEEGLCGTCHSDVPGEVAYVHGPVAVGDCVVCHHYHAAFYPKLLLADAKAICFRCHEPAHVIMGRHHAEIEDRLCVDCHNPHGGSNKFFLKRSEH